ERAVERDDAAKSRSRIAGQRLAIGTDEICTFGNPARVGVLDDYAGRGACRIEFGEAFISRIGVVDVVVRKFLALQLSRGDDAPPQIGRAIKCGALVRVFAITQRLDQPAAEGAEIGRLGLELNWEPI